MRYFLDTEFNGFGGGLISLALVREDGLPFYAIMHPDYMPIPTHEAPFTDTHGYVGGRGPRRVG